MFKKIKTILKTPKYRLIISLVLLIFLLILITKKRPGKIQPDLSGPLPSLSQIKKPEIEKNTISNYSIQNIQFTGQNPNFPKQLTLFETENEKDINLFCQEIAQSLGLKPVSLILQEIPTKVWEKENLSLVCSSPENKIRINSSPILQEKPNLNSAKEAVQLFIQKIGIDFEQFSFQEENLEYYQVSRQAQTYLPSTPEKGNLINLRYQKIVNSWPIYQPESGVFPLELLVGDGNSVVKLIYYPLFDQIKEKETYPLIDIEQAVEFLNQGKGELASLKYNDENDSGYSDIPLDIKGISSASLNQVQLVYFYSPEEGLLIPSYIFSGSGTASDNRKVSLTIFIPAIHPQYLVE